MIWRDSLKIGIEDIDSQHKELFDRFNLFLDIVLTDKKVEDKKNEIEKIFNFLDEYVVKHFEDEEKIQQEVKYPDYIRHCKIHRKFKEEILEVREKFKEVGYDESVFQRLSGKIAAWLVNHIALEDQKLSDYINKKTDKNYMESNFKKENKYSEVVIKVMPQVLERMLQSKSNIDIISEINIEKNINIEISIIGEAEWKIIYSFDKEMALAVVKRLSGMEFEEVDEFVIAALLEIVNIVSGNSTEELHSLGYNCDITVPRVMTQDEEIMIEEKTEVMRVKTDMGSFRIVSNFA
jgi:hemerythrin